MENANEAVKEFVEGGYTNGFVTDIESDTFPAGLNEAVITALSAKKQEPDVMLQRRLKAYDYWKMLEEPHWAKLHYPALDYQAISYCVV